MFHWSKSSEPVARTIWDRFATKEAFDDWRDAWLRSADGMSPPVDYMIEDGVAVFTVSGLTRDDLSLREAMEMGCEIGEAIGFPVLFRSISGAPGAIDLEFAIADFDPRTGSLIDTEDRRAGSREYGALCAAGEELGS